MPWRGLWRDEHVSSGQLPLDHHYHVAHKLLSPGYKEIILARSIFEPFFYHRPAVPDFDRQSFVLRSLPPCERCAL